MRPGVQIARWLAAACVALAAGCAASASFPASSPAPAPTAAAQPVLHATRLFAGPGQFPPSSFKAYGIVAFPAGPTSADISRYRMFCEAYVATLLSTRELATPVSSQIVTVWPVNAQSVATRLNNAPASLQTCQTASDAYGLRQSIDAIDAAKLAHATLSGRGPFMLAWSPAAREGQPDALVLVADLSDMSEADEAKSFFMRWAAEIEKKPELWRDGWDRRSLWQVFRANWHGAAVTLLGRGA